MKCHDTPIECDGINDREWYCMTCTSNHKVNPWTSDGFLVWQPFVAMTPHDGVRVDRVEVTTSKHLRDKRQLGVQTTCIVDAHSSDGGEVPIGQYRGHIINKSRHDVCEQEENDCTIGLTEQILCSIGVLQWQLELIKDDDCYLDPRYVDPETGASGNILQFMNSPEGLDYDATKAV